MHFIEEFLNGKSFTQIISNIINDNEINKKRQFYKTRISKFDKY